MSRLRRLGWPVLAMAVMLRTQPSIEAFEWPQGPDSHIPEGPGRQGGPPPPMQPSHGPMDRSMHVGPPGKWWSDPRFVQILGLTPDQQKRMDDVFNQNRLKLIDLSAALQKEEAILEPLLAADRPDEPKILLQIDRVAQARAELEKGNARMLLGLRGVLTQEQWKRLQADAPRGGHRPPPRF
jgi:Spy/CpxP family protein refolding chaperone